MGIDLNTLIICGVVGGIAAAIVVMQMNKRVRQLRCPGCGRALVNRKPGKRTVQQVLMGGWICPSCGCDVDRHGNKRGG